MKNVMMMSATIREMTKVDRKRGTCLPMTGMVSCPAPHHGSGEVRGCTVTKN